MITSISQVFGTAFCTIRSAMGIVGVKMREQIDVPVTVLVYLIIIGLGLLDIKLFEWVF